MKLLPIVGLLLTGTAFAAGDAHGGGPSTLVWPFINLGLLVGFLVWKLKGPTVEMFVKKSDDIKSSLEQAQSKAREAAMMIEEEKKKAERADEEVDSIISNANKDIANFEKEYKEETAIKIGRLKQDASGRIETEKKELMAELNEVLINSVIEKTKQTLKTDSGLNKKATENLLGEIR